MTQFDETDDHVRKEYERSRTRDPYTTPETRQEYERSRTKDPYADYDKFRKEHG